VKPFGKTKSMIVNDTSSTKVSYLCHCDHIFVIDLTKKIH